MFFLLQTFCVYLICLFGVYELFKKKIFSFSSLFAIVYLRLVTLVAYNHSVLPCSYTAQSTMKVLSQWLLLNSKILPIVGLVIIFVALEATH